ncbi:MAG TPA: VWA domain-containing protein [Vicinamibacterales bacterium]|nr:VWA domain-containing protein [Vicinamibacterales bacterium]
MRAWLIGVCLAMVAVDGVSGQDPKPKPQDPQPPQPVFRAGVELVTVDVTALDNNTGRQVIDLTAKDFEVEIDGDRRQVTSAEYVRSVDPLRVIGAPHKVVVPDETFSSSNAKGAPSGRLILILVDQGNIRTGSARSVMNSAKKFVDTLTPEDRVAVVAIPGPGELVDFTTNHDRVREALLRIVGQAGPIRSRFNLSVTESMALYMRSDAQLALEVILRECGSVTAAVEAERCEREVEQDAAEVVNEVRQRTADSVHGMRSVLKSLGALEGPKSVILLSEGLIFEGLGGETDDLASVAADSRATLDILLLDVPLFDVAQSQRPTTPREDRNLQVSGLEQLAGASRGQLHRINTSADFAFDRISRSLDGYYLLGVESRADDRDGRRHRLSVKTTRRGVTIRSRRTFLTTLSAKASTPEDAVAKAIRSPLPINDLPLKVSTWTYKEPGTNKVRVLIAAEVERLAGQSLEYTTGMAMVNRQGRGVAPPTKKSTLTEKAGDPGTAVYSGMMSVDPGVYRLIISMADSEGRVGSVSRAVTAWQMDGTGVMLGDLLLGGISDTGKAVLEPAIEPVIAGGQMAALMEAYGKTLTGVDGTLEILRDEDSPPLASMPLRIGAGASPEIATASTQFNTTALPPGRYLARGVIRLEGKPQGHLLRPFRIISDTANATSGAAVPSAGGALPVEMITVLLGGLSTFDRKELLTPAMLTAMYATAESRATGSKAAIKEARGGDLGGAAMTALGEGDQVLAMFLKGLELYQQSQLDRAAMQFQNSMQLAPTFAPSRLYLGATLAEANRHREAAGLLQAASTTPPNAAVARLAGEEWIKAAQPALAIAPLELASKQPNPESRAIKLLGIAYVLGGRPADAVATLAPYLETNPKDTAALIAAIFGTYIRHLNAPQPATLAADRANVAKWSKAYYAAKAPMQPLVAAWVKHVQDLK